MDPPLILDPPRDRAETVQLRGTAVLIYKDPVTRPQQSFYCPRA